MKLSLPSLPVLLLGCLLTFSAGTLLAEDIRFGISDDEEEMLLVAQNTAGQSGAGSGGSGGAAGGSAGGQRPSAAPSSAAAGASQNQSRPPSNSFASVARVPNMFGDSFPPSITSFFRTCNVGMQSSVVTEAITAGGTRYTPIGENNRPIPTDRVYFLYNGFQNVVTTTDLVANNSFDSDLHRYTLGFEKTFNDKNASIELRLPFTKPIDLQLGDYSSSTANMGNLMLVSKHLLLKTEDTAIATGLGIGLPTADDFTAVTGAANVRLRNEGVYLLPYLGWAKTINEDWFSIVYAELEIATGGDTFEASTIGTLGKINAPTFARFDISVGRWLLNDLDYQYLTGIAAIAEFHYLTTLSDNDTLVGGDGINSFAVTGVDNRVDYLNVTTGVQFQLTSLSNFRVSGVFPVRTDPDRQFDGELQVAFNRNF